MMEATEPQVGSSKSHRLWGGRFGGGPADAAWRLNWSLPVDVRLWPHDVRAARAWVEALCRAGVLTANEQSTMLDGLERVADRLANGAASGADDEDVHTLVERLLFEEIGELAGKLNTGRSRNDQVATDLRLWAMTALDKLAADVRALANALVAQARGGVDILLPAYTHGQRAQPVRWSHVMLAHAWPLTRDLGRIAEAQERAAELPLGSGAVAGTVYDVDRTALMTQLGFRRLSPNSLDATGDRDFAADTLFVMGMVAMHVSRLAGELLLYTTSEFAFVRLSDAYCTGSSLLPQKRNPDVLELSRGGASCITADLNALLALLSGLPAGYSKDLQEDKRMLFDAADRLELILPAMRGAIESMVPEVDRMGAALSPALLATDLADALVARDIRFREAHRIVGLAVQAAERAEKTVVELSRAQLEEVHSQLPDAVATLGDFEASIERRASQGGSSRTSVLEQIGVLEEALA